MNLPFTKPTTDCDNCRSNRGLFLHHIRLRGQQWRLCTSCVLALHPASFCPSCFQHYDVVSSSSSPSSNPPPSPNNRITCVKCSSISHYNCVSAFHRFPSSSYLCPPCADPRFLFFEPDSKNGKRSIDKKSARVLLCAARIAAISMTNAVNSSKSDAEKRVREADVARKRAREAMEHVALVDHQMSGEIRPPDNVVPEKGKNLNCGRISVKLDNPKMTHMWG